MNGKIYGLVGPNGGGKSYKQRDLLLATDTDTKFIAADFSDGIRSLICRMVTGCKDYKIDVLSEEYARWKQVKQAYFLPDLTVFTFDGRSMMQNLGEAVKDVYPDFWAKYTSNLVLEEINKLSQEERDNAIICFGSVRFKCEVDAMVYMSSILSKPIEFIFCNYWDVAPKENPHTSEVLANNLIIKGYNHNQIIKMEDLQ